MFIYEPPKQWTEKLLNDISDEDNRYEFKEWKSDLNDLQSMLAKEICALANSFGGTLFLGVEDETKEIVGVPKQGKGRANSRSWVESLIPNLLEFRLPNFRVLEVDLSKKTKDRIGSDKTVLSIDIYDSDLAPHRSLKHKDYFYRQSSMSVPAPHHYLAYLWGRSNPNMSNVIIAWFRGYVNDAVILLERTARDFAENKFNVIDNQIAYSRIINREIVFFEETTWKALNSTLIAKQFLRTFADIHIKVNEIDALIKDFFNYFTKIKNVIEVSPEFERTIRRLYDEAMFREGFKQPHQFDDKPFEEIIRLYAGQVLEKMLPGIREFPAELNEILVRMTAYNFVSPDSISLSVYSTLFNFCKDQIVDQFVESANDINSILYSIKTVQNEIALKADSLAKELTELRYALALKHNTTYE